MSDERRREEDVNLFPAFNFHNPEVSFGNCFYVMQPRHTNGNDLSDDGITKTRSSRYASINPIKLQQLEGILYKMFALFRMNILNQSPLARSGE